MGTGREYLHKVNEALAGFEEAVARRERPGLLKSKVTTQQDVDRAREEVLDVVVQIVTAERMKHETRAG